MTTLTAFAITGSLPSMPPADSVAGRRASGDAPPPWRSRPQIFQESIHSKSFVPAGFMACLVETTSMGLMVTKS